MPGLATVRAVRGLAWGENGTKQNATELCTGSAGAMQGAQRGIGARDGEQVFGSLAPRTLNERAGLAADRLRTREALSHSDYLGTQESGGGKGGEGIKLNSAPAQAFRVFWAGIASVSVHVRSFVQRGRSA